MYLIFFVKKKLNTLANENLDLRNEISKHSGVSPNLIRPGQV